MSWGEIVKELVRKIELQSIIVFMLTLTVGLILIYDEKSIAEWKSITGLILIGFGALFSVVSFFTNNIRESYKDIIEELRTTIKTIRTESHQITKQYQKVLDDVGTSTSSRSEIQSYKSDISDLETQTK